MPPRALPSINPNADRDYIKDCNVESHTEFPKFLHSIELHPFKQINELTIEFTSPITVISGTNKIGKTTLLIALACSHYNFKKRNVTNGNFERHTWGGFMKITQHDIQNVDWSYWIEFREGTRKTRRQGQRKLVTKKWNGIAKKESQIQDRQVVFIDLDRVLPARNVSNSLYKKAQSTHGTSVANNLTQYLSYIFEESYSSVSILAEHLGKDVFGYTTGARYSGFNSASGEDVVTKILLDIIEADRNALILLDEIELGLHPKVQRRLLEVINFLARHEKKQFIITTHSPSIFAHIDPRSRIFIDKHADGTLRCIQNATLNEALCKMDADLYPAIDLFCEDDVAEMMIKKMYQPIKDETEIKLVDKLVNIIISRSASQTYQNFAVHKRTYENKKIKTGHLCVLDGDMRIEFPTEEGLYHLPSNLPPEKYLLSVYLIQNPNATLQYHLEQSNAHILFSKMVEAGVAIDKKDAFEKCWQVFEQTPEYSIYKEQFISFITAGIRKFS